MNTESVDAYIRDGCGRCDLYRTPECKVLLWTEPLEALRDLLLESELVEEMKWGNPCYTLDGKNVIMLASVRRHCALSFFKGAALEDEGGLLSKPGPNSRYARLFTFTSSDEVEHHEDAIKGFIEQAINLERDGVEVIVDDDDELPAELEHRLSTDPDLQRAFDALTPGRQRSHILHVSGAKKSETRARRAEKCVARILLGKGFNER